MQRIERYGVIAILLLLVTVLAVSMWGDDEVNGSDSSKPTLASVPATRRAPVAERRTAQRPPANQAGRQDNSRLTDRMDLTKRSDQTNQRQLAANQRANTNPVPTPITNQGTNQSASLAADQRARQAQARREEQLANSARLANRNSAPANPGARQQPNSDLTVTKDATLPTSSLVRTEPKVSPKVSPVAPAAAGTNRVASTWTVKRGETLSEIAQQALGSAKLWPKIVAANPSVDPNRLSVGAKLVLPTGAAVAQTSKPTTVSPTNANSSGNGTYTVRSGDMLSVIAQRELGSAKRWQEIMALNPGVDPKHLLVGTRLTLPGGATKVNTSSAIAAVTPPKSNTRRARVR